MKKIAILFSLFAAIALGFTSCGNPESKKETKQTIHQHKEGEAHQHVYQCATDCEKGRKYNQPGKCPVCQKDLQEKTTEHPAGDGHIH
ncbi:MAG: hypothetical protein IPJ53_13290 [Saprospiraceae bacterium]|nr:hypothetical protein [Candidatus Vicinibacter affinis]